VFFLVVILAVLGLAVLALERGWLGL